MCGTGLDEIEMGKVERDKIYVEQNEKGERKIVTMRLKQILYCLQLENIFAHRQKRVLAMFHVAKK